MINRVGDKIAKAAQKWIEYKGYKGYLDKYRWEFNLIVAIC